MTHTPPKLPLTEEEKRRMKASRTKLGDIARLDAAQLAERLGASEERALRLRGLAQFQAVPSIGPKVAERLVQMGYRSLDEMETLDGAELIDRWERLCGYWEDPCLEDAFRCVVHHAQEPDSEKSWHDFTAERKAYRARHGYPADRPAVPWHERFGKKAGETPGTG